jgi:hypothetical protein
MCQALNMVKIAKSGYSRAAIQNTQYQIKHPHDEDPNEQKWGFELLGHNRVKAAIERHTVMLRPNQMDGCLIWRIAL